MLHDRPNGALSKSRILDFGTGYWFWSARSVWRAQRPNIVAPVISVTFTGIVNDFAIKNPISSIRFRAKTPDVMRKNGARFNREILSPLGPTCGAPLVLVTL